MSGRLFNVLASQSWAITEDALQRMIEVYALALERKDRGDVFDKQAVEKQLGRKLDNTHTVTTRSGVATIPVEGAIFRHADMFTDMSGGTTVETLAQDFNRALNDQSVESIVLLIDSPGGEVNGINEFSNHIFEARGTKPIIAYVAHTGASAAYWIASAADEIVADATAALGSIGVVAAMRDPSKQNTRDIEFVSSQSPNKRPDPTTEKGKAQIQFYVDATAQVFIDTIARNRSVSTETVANDFGAGGLLVGQMAVDAGLADRLGSYEELLSELASGAYKDKRRDKKDFMPDAKAGAIAPKTGANHKEKTMSEKSWLQRLFGSMTEEERTEAATHLSTQPPAPTGISGRVEDKTQTAEIEGLKAKAAAFDKLNAEQREQAATAFVQNAVTAGHVLPAAQDALKADYLQRAGDDERSPLANGSRVEQLTSLVAGLPANNLSRERASGLPAKLAVLANDEDPDAKMAEEVNAQVDAYDKQVTPKRLKGVK
ncbi:MAG: S49 family peptidase [Pyrinomonadaceae bacterium]